MSGEDVTQTVGKMNAGKRAGNKTMNKNETKPKHERIEVKMNFAKHDNGITIALMTYHKDGIWHATAILGNRIERTNDGYCKVHNFDERTDWLPLARRQEEIEEKVNNES